MGAIGNPAHAISTPRVAPSEALPRLVKDAIDDSGKERAQIASELGALLGQHIAVYQVNRWTAQSKTNSRFPAAFIAAFCEVTGDDRLQRFVMGPRLQKLVRLGEIELERKEIKASLRRSRKKGRA